MQLKVEVQLFSFCISKELPAYQDKLRKHLKQLSKNHTDFSTSMGFTQLICNILFYYSLYVAHAYMQFRMHTKQPLAKLQQESQYKLRTFSGLQRQYYFDELPTCRCCLEGFEFYVKLDLKYNLFAPICFKTYSLSTKDSF